MPKSYNLTALAADLRGRGIHTEVADLIQTQTHISSRQADLLHAADLVARLAELEQTKVKNPAGSAAWNALATVQGAVLAQAIILYVRSTNSGDRNRPVPFQVEDFLTPQQQAIHASLRLARNRAIAHVDAEDRQDWHTDALVVVRREDGAWHYGSPHNRTTYRGEVHRWLKTLLDVALPYVGERAKHSMDVLNTKLLDAIGADVALDPLIEAHPFDAAAFYGASPEAAAALQRILEGGDGSFVWNTSTPSRSP